MFMHDSSLKLLARNGYHLIFLNYAFRTYFGYTKIWANTEIHYIHVILVLISENGTTYQIQQKSPDTPPPIHFNLLHRLFSSTPLSDKSQLSSFKVCRSIYLMCRPFTIKNSFYAPVLRFSLCHSKIPGHQFNSF
jgi:hypothetical protein